VLQTTLKTIHTSNQAVTNQAALSNMILVAAVNEIVDTVILAKVQKVV